MSNKYEIALEAAKRIYSINVEQRGIRNKAHYVELIQGAVLEAIEEAEKAAREKGEGSGKV